MSAPGTTVVAASAHAGSNIAVAYAIAEHTVLWCDPTLAEPMAPLVDADRPASLDECDAFLTQLGWTPEGRAHMQVLGPTGLRRPTVDGHRMRSLDVTSAADQALLTTFKSTLTAEERDEADLDDSPDEHIVVVLDDAGVAAYASQSPFAPAAQFADIAVATRPDIQRSRPRASRRRAVVRRDHRARHASALPARRQKRRIGAALRRPRLHPRHRGLRLPRPLNLVVYVLQRDDCVTIRGLTLSVHPRVGRTTP